jgi:hypothetical protein
MIYILLSPAPMKGWRGLVDCGMAVGAILHNCLMGQSVAPAAECTIRCCYVNIALDCLFSGAKLLKGLWE